MEVSAARVTAVVLLLVLHLVFFVAFSATYPSPDNNHYYPGASELGDARMGLSGNQVALSGLVVESSPVVVSTGNNRYRLTGVGGVEMGSQLEIHGVVQEDSVRVLDYVEYTRGGLVYAYMASFVAGLWVLARLLNHWGVRAGGLGRDRGA